MTHMENGSISMAQGVNGSGVCSQLCSLVAPAMGRVEGIANSTSVTSLQKFVTEPCYLFIIQLSRIMYYNI